MMIPLKGHVSIRLWVVISCLVGLAVACDVGLTGPSPTIKPLTSAAHNPAKIIGPQFAIDLHFAHGVPDSIQDAFAEAARGLEGVVKAPLPKASTYLGRHPWGSCLCRGHGRHHSPLCSLL